MQNVVSRESADSAELYGNQTLVASNQVFSNGGDHSDLIHIESLCNLTPETPVTPLSDVTNSEEVETITAHQLPGELPIVAAMYDNSPAIHGSTSTGIDSRNKMLFNLAYSLKKQGADFEEIYSEVTAKNIQECIPQLSNEEVARICGSISNLETADPSGWFFEELLSHASVAKSIVESHGEHLRWTSDTKEWYQYNELSGFWKYCDNVVLGKIFLDEIEFLQKRVQNNSTFDSKIKIVWLTTLQKAKSSSFTKGVISLLPSVSNINNKFTEFDSDPYVVGLPDKQYFDLRTINVRPIKPTDNLTKSIGTSYDVNATCPIWEKSVLEWCCDDKQQALFLQTLVGYALSGLMTDQRLYFLYGNGKNGKSVFVNTLAGLYGQNGLSIDPSSLMNLKRSSGQANGDIARLVGKRFISSNELPNNGMFNEKLIKRITSGDTTVARQLYKSEFEFAPIGKLFISGNNQPIIRGRDEGIWRRMTLIPFDAKIASPNRFLDTTLKKELSGILNWAIRGWEIFASNNMKLTTPDNIKKATAQYRFEMDILARWKNDCLKPDNNKKLSLADIYASYKEWCIQESISFMSSSSFNRETKNMFEKKREKNGNVVSGYCLGRGGSAESFLTI